MKLELKNRASCLTIESLTSTHFTCDVCPDSVSNQAIGVLYYDYTENLDNTMLDPREVNIEIKFCINCKEIIRAFFNNLE